MTICCAVVAVDAQLVCVRCCRRMHLEGCMCYVSCYVIMYMVFMSNLHSVAGHNTKYHDCYWQAYVQNMAILMHWKEPVNTKVYFWDSDEYLVFQNGYSRDAYFRLLESHPIVGVKRHMVFCADCPTEMLLFPEVSVL